MDSVDAATSQGVVAPTGVWSPPPDHLGVDLADLILRSASGCHHAFAELYGRTSAQVYGLTLRILRAPELASEVTQEVYIDVWTKSGRFDPGRGSALGWMLTIARRRSIDRVRSITRATAHDEHWQTGQLVVSSVDDVWDQLVASLDADVVRRALGALTTVQRQALYLTYLCGYTSVEAGRMLKVPPATVKTRMRDGLIRLRRQVGEHQPMAS